MESWLYKNDIYFASATYFLGCLFIVTYSIAPWAQHVHATGLSNVHATHAQRMLPTTEVLAHGYSYDPPSATNVMVVSMAMWVDMELKTTCTQQHTENKIGSSKFDH